VIGTPTDEDLGLIQSEDARKYIKCFKPCPPTDLAEMYPAVEDRGLELLKKMLMFD